MVKIIKKKEFLENEKFYIEEYKKGKIFIIPTCTVYGLSCDSSNKKAVKKIYEIKKKKIEKPFSIIAPSRIWILKNFKIDLAQIHYLFKIPKQKITLIINKKKSSKFSNYVNTKENGIRIVENFIQKFVKKLNSPIIATSVNLTGKKPIIKISQIPKVILDKVDYIIDNGVLNNKPTKIINIKSKKVLRF